MCIRDRLNATPALKLQFQPIPTPRSAQYSMADPERIEILSERELGLTLSRLASQVLESAEDSRRLMLLGIPTRGVQLSRVLARELERLTGHAISQGAIDPTFHRDDLERIGTRLPQLTTLPTSLSLIHISEPTRPY